MTFGSGQGINGKNDGQQDRRDLIFSGSPDTLSTALGQGTAAKSRFCGVLFFPKRAVVLGGPRAGQKRATPPLQEIAVAGHIKQAQVIVTERREKDNALG